MFKERLQKIIGVSSQKDGIIERFLLNRCNFVVPEDEQDSVFWKLLCYEIMYLWNLLGSCSAETLSTIINDCKEVDESTEPIFGLSQFLMGASYAALNDFDQAILCYKTCIDKCNENPPNLCYIPAYANYELAAVLVKSSRDDSKSEAQQLLQNAQAYKNYDFEHRLKLKVHSLKIC